MSSEYRDIVERFAEGLSPQEFALFEQMTEEQRKDVMSRAGVLRDSMAQGGIINRRQGFYNGGGPGSQGPGGMGAEGYGGAMSDSSGNPAGGGTGNDNGGGNNNNNSNFSDDDYATLTAPGTGIIGTNFNLDPANPMSGIQFGGYTAPGQNPSVNLANALAGNINQEDGSSNNTVNDTVSTSSEAIANTNIAPNLGIIDSLFSGVYNFGTTQALKAENIKRKAAGLAEIDQDMFNAMNEQSFGIQDLVDRYFGSGITDGLTNAGTDLTNIAMPGTLQALTAGFNTLTGQPALSASPTSGFYSSVPDDLSGMYKDTGSIGYGIRNALAENFGVEYSDPNVGRYTDLDKMLGAGAQINESYAGGMTQSDYASAVAAGAFADPALANAFREKEMMEKAEERAATRGNEKPVEIDYAAQAAAATAAITANYDSTQLAYFNDLVAKGYPEDYAASVVASILG